MSIHQPKGLSHSIENLEPRLSRRELIVKARNLAALACAGSLFASPSSAEAVPSRCTLAEDRFDISDFTDPHNPQNFREGQKTHEAIRQSTDHPSLWLCDDVSKKDKDKHGFNIPSPSVTFEAAKAVQLNVTTQVGSMKLRKQHLDELKKIADNAKFRVRDPEEQVRYQALLELIAENEPVNTACLEVWKSLEKRAKKLRENVKKAVKAERSAGLKLKRCAIECGDLDMGDISGKFPAKPYTPKSELKTHAQAQVPSVNAIEPFSCKSISENEVETGQQSESIILEHSKLLEQKVQSHIDLCIQRGEAYIQMKFFASTLKGKDKAKRKRALIGIAKKGEKENKKVRKLWESVLKEMINFKTELIMAENKKTELADEIGRCQPNY